MENDGLNYDGLRLVANHRKELEAQKKRREEIRDWSIIIGSIISIFIVEFFIRA